MNISRFKALIVLLFLCLLQQTALFAQSGKKITIVKDGITIKAALAEVERQTGFSIAYNESKLGADRHVDLALRDASLELALDRILDNTGFSWKIKDSYVIISRKQENLSIIVHGTVLDEAGQPMIGAGILVKGKPGKGTVTDIDGKWSIDVAKGDVLEVSSLGYVPVEVTVTDRKEYNVSMSPDSKMLDEVVVTALGITRSEKALTYNVQTIDGDELTSVKSTNFLNSLAGKAAGVVINSSASGPGGAVKVVMRGAKSISQSNNALYVIDGIPMFNRTAADTEGSMASAPGTESIADINPDDIESMTLLTGPSAAALYGYEGANGVVLITTKKGKADKTSVTFSNSTTFSNPMMMPKFQDKYANIPGQMASWGGLSEYTYSPSGFFRTGSNVSNTLAIATGNEKSQTYLSASTTNAAGILPNNRYNRYNFNFRNTTSFFKEKFLLDVSAAYILQNDRNMTSHGQYFNPLPALYLFPRGESFGDIAVYERYDEASGVCMQYWPYGNEGLSLQNPYWIMNRMLRENNKRRYKIAASLKYDIAPWINLQGRASIDNTENKYTDKRYSGTDGNFAGQKGRYQQAARLDRQVYADVMLNVDKRWENLSMTLNAGASIKDTRMEYSSLTGDINHVTNFFTIENLTRNGYYKVDADGMKRQTQSVFGNAELGWKNFLFLNLTVRNDWDSALAFSLAGDDSFIYPSAGLSAIISEAVDMPSWFTFLKVRGSYTSVGNSYDPYLTKLRYVYSGVTDNYEAQTLYPNYNLRPEITESWEAGINMRFFDNTLNLDLTYYNSDTRNQTFVAPLAGSSGYTGVYVQAGGVRNYGIEAALGYNNEWNGFGWSSNVTASWNRNRIISLANGVTNPVTGEPISMEYVNKSTLGGTGSPTVRLVAGGTMGDIYIHRDFKRDDNGYIYLTKGVPTIVDTEYRKIGSLLPDANAGWRNSFSYKGIRLNVLLTARFGGKVVSNTQAYLDRYGVSEYSARLREAGGVTIIGETVSAQDYLNVITNGGGEGDHYVYDATNIRLQEMSLEYTLDRKYLKNVCDMTFGFVANNLVMIYCKAPFDPELAASASSTFYTGVDYFMQPSLRNFGFSVKLQF